MQNINIGLTDEQRQGVIGLLNHDLSDSYLLLVKTKKYHWDVVGPQFMSLHKMWEDQYVALTENIDKIAERVRTLGGYPIGTMEGFLQLASLKEHSGEVPMPTDMVRNLLEDHETVVRNLREHIDQSSENFGDEGTADFLTGLMEAHEEIAWMLRSFLEGESLMPSGDRPAVSSREAVGV